MGKPRAALLVLLYASVAAAQEQCADIEVDGSINVSGSLLRSCVSSSHPSLVGYCLRVLHYPLSIVLSDAPDGFVDLLLLLARFGSSDPGAADINGDGACDVSDLLGLLAA